VPDDKKLSFARRAGTILGDRNESRTARTPPRGVGLTEPPPPPRGEFENFESKTPIGTEPHIWRALREFQKQNQLTDEAIKFDVQVLREGHLVIGTKLDTLLDISTKNDEAAEKRRKYTVPIITAVGVIIIGVVTAIMHGCS